MSEDGAGPMVETGKNKTGLTDPHSTDAESPPPGGQTDTGLPGLAAFGSMQAYTPSTQPAPGEQAQDRYQPEAVEEVAEVLEQAYVPKPEEQFADPAVESAPAYSDQEVYTGQPQYADAALEASETAGLTNGAQAYQESTSDEPDAGYHFEDAYAEEEIQPYEAGHDGLAAGGQYQQISADAAPGEAFTDAAGETPEHDQQTALQAFEARYDQHPEVPLGSFDEPDAQPFFPQETQQDADFLEPEFADEQMPPPKERSNRKTMMFGAGLLGALALGGALAFAYKTGGNPQLAEGGAPPLIQADSRPVKVAPDQPGGKQFPHQNKQIYDRLQGESKPEVEKIVPRQEQVASAPSGAGPAAERPAQTPSPTGQAVASLGATSSQQGATPDAPHKVRTLQVRPDGSVVNSAAPAAAPPQPVVPAAPLPGTNMVAAEPVPVPMPPPPAAAAPTPAPAAVDRTTVASVPQQQAGATSPPAPASAPAAAAPLPQPKPVKSAPVKTASAPAQSAAPAPSGSIFVVQVASRRSQAMALAAYADLQQKYTSLLGSYQPMIQSADLGNKGTWYRLRLGPMRKKAEAETLCRKLRGAGLRSCLVRPL